MTDNTFIDPNTDNLDDFSALMFGSAKPAPEAPKEPVEVDVEDDVLDNALEDNTDDLDNQELDQDVTDEPAPEPEAKPKRKTAQERINELTAARKEAERAAEAEKAARSALEAKLAELESRLPAAQAPLPQADDRPSPTALNEDGTVKYPLGEFDATYIADITRWTIENVTREKEAQAQKEAQAKAAQQANVQLQQKWQDRLSETEKTIPDLRTKAQELVTTFSSIPQDYGEFLSQTIMQMDAGPEVLYHLANHLDEAEEIVSKGPLGATLALGRLEARLAKSEQPKPRVSSAPKPAPTTRGLSVGGSVPGDTDDLDAFSAAFFSRKGRK